jgi:hypothetical protein
MTHHAPRITHDASRMTHHESRFTAGVVAIVLGAVYALTLAPAVTLWDSGEFQAAIATLGIPHPPGTPLYILVGNAWVRALPVVPLPLALNLLSAVSTAIACALMAGLMARWTKSRLAGIAAGISAGSMLAVWLNATETEIYAVAMLLGVLMILAGERAGATGSIRYRALLAYLMGLAVPVQISALVAAPAAIVLASTSPERAGLAWRRLVALCGLLGAAIAVSQGSAALLAAGLGSTMLSHVGRASPDRGRAEPLALVALLVIGLSPTLFMLVRATHDPLINQGNATTFGAMMDVVTRQQYPLPGMWPRRAPVWVQLLNLVQYADWQVASGLDLSVAASWRRTPFSVAAMGLLILGARWHWRTGRWGARGVGVLLLASSLGVVAVLNLSAGPSILDAVLPPGTMHEPRERDYFFALAFLAAGLWIGVGAVAAASRWLARRPVLVAPAALAIAALPVALNWTAATRRPDGMIATTLGEALAASAPPRAVLFLAGDNDSYTVWHRQAVYGERRDVAPVTIPLLGAGWYRAELRRRYHLLDSTMTAVWHGEAATLEALVAGAAREGRPVAASLSVSPAIRTALAPGWTLSGMTYVARSDSGAPLVDGDRTRMVADLIARRDRITPRGRDPASFYNASLLRCPSAALRLGSDTTASADGALLDSRCNLK